MRRGEEEFLAGSRVRRVVLPDGTEWWTVRMTGPRRRTRLCERSRGSRLASYGRRRSWSSLAFGVRVVRSAVVSGEAAAGGRAAGAG
ncbi:hypothetical protein ACFV0Z_07670 [Streptomyces xiamenensis]|uniref:hypothetical protein n=1 Tax=Streptomyces xiamenensis TaxID=408015 RepID=UPI0036B6F7A0